MEWTEYLPQFPGTYISYEYLNGVEILDNIHIVMVEEEKSDGPFDSYEYTNDIGLTLYMVGFEGLISLLNANYTCEDLGLFFSPFCGPRK